MNKFKGQYDFGKKLKWNPAYIQAPGTGPEFDAEDRPLNCSKCIHFGHDIEVGASFPKTNDTHFYFCNKVLETVGVAKGIKKETATCSDFKQRARGIAPHTTLIKSK